MSALRVHDRQGRVILIDLGPAVGMCHGQPICGTSIIPAHGPNYGQEPKPEPLPDDACGRRTHQLRLAARRYRRRQREEAHQRWAAGA